MPIGSSTTAPCGTNACLRIPASRAAGFWSMRGNRAMIAAIRCCRASSSSSSTPAKVATTSPVRSSAVGPSPPLVTTSTQPAAAQ